jgi:predicted DNA binding CopG/RHH family protein
MINDKRTNKVTVYLTDYELERLKKDATTENLSLAVLIRRILESNKWMLKEKDNDSGKFTW